MASSRDSSLLRDSSPASPSQLTPTSKVKAMLAALDNDSDDSETTGTVRSRLMTTARQSTPSKKTTKVTDAIKTGSLETTNNSTGARETPDQVETSDDDEDIRRPRGKLASRMQPEHNASSADDEAIGDARDRVKRMLSRKKSPSKASKQASVAEDSLSSSESDGPVTSRKQRARPSPSRTPASARSVSSGLFVSPAANQKTSPGLFGSPSVRKSVSPSEHSSDSDHLPQNPVSGNRFMALLEKRRQEQLEKDATVLTEKKKKAEIVREQAAALEDDVSENSDDNAQRLTQQARPTRKASKKALEEMHRETQRMSRNMQLAHEARTKKKITKASLFARFNYKPAGMEPEPSLTSSSPARMSEIEARETPPTSPASPTDSFKATTASVAHTITDATTIQQEEKDVENNVEVSLIETKLFSPVKLDKGKGKAIDSEITENVNRKPIQPKRVRVQLPMGEDSDSDLEIVGVKKLSTRVRMDSLFNNVPTKQAAESQSIRTLRMLAHVTSPSKQGPYNDKKSLMTTTELQMSLQQRARRQAVLEREERMKALRDKGVIIQSSEDRAKELAEVEDLISKARRDAEELSKRERAAAKKERKENGEEPAEDSSDDEDWQEKGDEQPGSGSDEEEDIENSGEESGEDGFIENDEDEEGFLGVPTEVPEGMQPLFDNEAEESSDEEDEEMENGADISMAGDAPQVNDEDEEDEELLPVAQNWRRTRKLNVISDEEDEEDDIVTQSPLRTFINSPVQQRTDSPIAPQSVLRSATKTFIPGLNVVGPAGLGLTQIFAGTMDDSQTSPSAANSRTQKSSFKDDRMAFLRQGSVPQLPDFIPTMADTQDIIMDSQSRIGDFPETQAMESITQGINLDFSQSQIKGFDSLVQDDPSDTQFSELPGATQDGGFQEMTPIRGRRFISAPPSTIDTVLVGSTAHLETVQESPIAKKKGKLRRRVAAADFSDEEVVPSNKAVDADPFDITVDAFDVMRKTANKKVNVVDGFDKKNSKAKNMVHEQAEESEDEYAGLGGASDDDSDGEEDLYVKEMIDDEAGKDLDESKLAAFYANRERVNDEKQVEKLYNDITKGMLRRKRGADYDLSDSDDGGEAKRRRKRKEFAKMRKALLADERIEKIAENPKKQAFLRAIEDRPSDDELDFLEDFHEAEAESQSQSQMEDTQQRVPDSQPEAAMGPPKRKRSDEEVQAAERLPPNLRRTKPAKKPSNISEIRESLSSLIEDPNSMFTNESSSEDELEIDGEPGAGSHKGKENRDPFALRRGDVSIIDRISLKRTGSNQSAIGTRLAFTASTTSSFKVPALLRRATTNSSMASTTSVTNTGLSANNSFSSTERLAGESGSSGLDGIRKGRGKNSGVNFFARENERRAKISKIEQKKEKTLLKGAEGRRRAVGALFAGGQFK